MKDAIQWFEIMASDFDRACGFYETVMGLTLTRAAMGEGKLGMFPSAKDGIGGAVWHDPRSKPSMDGTCVYLSAEGKIDEFLSRVAGSGGSVILPKMSIGEHGFIALFKDSEGNRVGFHSMSA